jgi:hypothetical protein
MAFDISQMWKQRKLPTSTNRKAARVSANISVIIVAMLTSILVDHHTVSNMVMFTTSRSITAYTSSKKKYL